MGCVTTSEKKSLSINTGVTCAVGNYLITGPSLLSQLIDSLWGPCTLSSFFENMVHFRMMTWHPLGCPFLHVSWQVATHAKLCTHFNIYTLCKHILNTMLLRMSNCGPKLSSVHSKIFASKCLNLGNVIVHLWSQISEIYIYKLLMVFAHTLHISCSLWRDWVFSYALIWHALCFCVHFHQLGPKPV